ncbi:MAG TPA: cytochrome c biogenesis protein CcdA [Candidatus Acidoferrales bacterium]|jgi:cytochrome c-type biogenesis protein
MHSLPLPIAAFIAGFVSFLSPCVLPLVPGYVSIISGASVEDLKHQSARLMRSVMLNSVFFILGFSLVFIALGAVASSFGQIVTQHFAIFSKFAGLLLVGFGVHMTGLLPFKFLYADKRAHRISGGHTPLRAFLVGFSFGFGWSPCVGPILTAILTFAAAEDTVRKGVALLAIYSLGLAIPFLLTSCAIDRFLIFYSRFRHHLRTLEIVSGAVMIAVGVLVFTRHFTIINSWMNQIPLFRHLSEKFL